MPLGRQQDSDPLGSPRRGGVGGGLGKRLSITPGDGVVFCCFLIPSPSFFLFFLRFCYFFPAMPVSFESGIELSSSRTKMAEGKRPTKMSMSPSSLPSFFFSLVWAFYRFWECLFPAGAIFPTDKNSGKNAPVLRGDRTQASFELLIQTHFR